MRPGGLRSLSSALKAAKLDITAIQETRWPGQNLLTSKDYKFYYSGKKDGPREFGTGFMVFGKSRNAVLGFNPVDERICTLRIRGKFFNYTLINVHAPTIGKYSLHETSNDNGLRVIDFAVSRNMVVSSTYFEKKNIHKAMWISPDGRTKNQIDHVLIDGRHCSDVLDVRSCRGPNVDSDHYLVKAVVKARVSTQHNRQSA